jgi:uncharacterized membrane protein
MGFKNVLGDHFDPIMMLLAPAYWVWDNARALLIAELLIVALGVFPVFSIAKRHLGNLPAIILSFVYAFSFGLINALDFPTHDLTLAGTFILFAFDFLERRKLWGYWIFIAFALLTKEDVSIGIAALGLYLCLFRKGARRIGIVTTVLATVYFFTVLKIVLPQLTDTYHHWIYWQWGKDPVEMLQHFIRNPADLVSAFINDPSKRSTLFVTGAWFGFLFLGAPSMLIIIVPMLAERFLSFAPLTWLTIFHYSAPIMSILLIGTVMGIKRISQIFLRFFRTEKTILYLAFFLLFVGLLLNYQQGTAFMRLFNPSWYAVNESETKLEELLANIPTSAAVSAQTDLLPHLSHRNKIYLFPNVNDAEFVVLAKNGNIWPLNSADYEKRVKALEANFQIWKENDYGTIYQKIDR